MRLLLVVACLLGSAASAQAECAWVPWAIPSIVDKMMPDGSIRTTPRGEWQIGTAFATQSECNGTHPISAHLEGEKRAYVCWRHPEQL